MYTGMHSNLAQKSCVHQTSTTFRSKPKSCDLVIVFLMEILQIANMTTKHKCTVLSIEDTRAP